VGLLVIVWIEVMRTSYTSLPTLMVEAGATRPVMYLGEMSGGLRGRAF